jgi:hypothetical protein
MVSEKAANKARELISDELFSCGAHGIAVDKVAVDGQETFAVIAMVPPKHKKPMPSSVNVTIGKTTQCVPVVVRKTEPFKPE